MPRRLTLSRRGLFRGIGTASLVAGCAPGGKGEGTQAPLGADGQPAEIGPDPSPVTFTLNGASTTVNVEPRTTLLTALRVDAGTTGPKEVCDRGACGACTVLVDGEPRNACMMLAHDVAGHDITTVEGLAGGGELTALQQAFVERDAMQCGFCTSGMLMSATALLRRTGGPVDADQVKDAIAGNLCRCGTYPHVISAVVDASKKGGA